MIFLSYSLNKNTPTYGGRNTFNIEKKSEILKGDIANDSYIQTTVHIGTHIDMPYHFYENGQTIEDFNANFWIFTNPLFIEIEPKGFIVEKELLEKLNSIKNNNYDILIVKTGECYKREKKEYMLQNIGFSPSIANFLREKFSTIRVFGFDTISISSFTNREVGRVAHKSFLNPSNPILLLEDMDLKEINSQIKLNKVMISPLRIEECDGLPCTIFGEISE